MAFIRTWKPFNSKPNYPVSVDWSNPLADSLAFACLDLGHANYYSIVQPGFSSLSPGTAPGNTVYPHPWYRECTLFNGGAHAYFPIAPFSNLDIINPPLTMLAIIKGNSSLANGAVPCGRTYNNGASNWMFAWSSGGNINILYDSNGATGTTANMGDNVHNLSTTTNECYVIAVTFGGVDAVDFYGYTPALGPYTANTFTTALVGYEGTAGQNQFMIGDNRADVATSVPWQGSVPFIMVWNRALPATQIKAVLKNPYALLRQEAVLPLRYGLLTLDPNSYFPYRKPNRIVHV